MRRLVLALALLLLARPAAASVIHDGVLFLGLNAGHAQQTPDGFRVATRAEAYGLYALTLAGDKLQGLWCMSDFWYGATDGGSDGFDLAYEGGGYFGVINVHYVDWSTTPENPTGDGVFHEYWKSDFREPGGLRLSYFQNEPGVLFAKSIPEPSGAALLCVGLAVLASLRRR